jgi:putative acetyltransferase
VAKWKKAGFLVTIRKGLSSDYPALLALWRRSVTASHAFLTKKDIQEIEKELTDSYLPALEIWICEVDDAVVSGFMGLDGPKVEMLFVEPGRRGKGVGSFLLTHASRQYGTLTLDVNEQNPLALGFYLHYGFKEIGRSTTDAAGRPFPLIHMKFDGIDSHCTKLR